MNAPTAKPISPAPGGLKSVLIHLAGADPKVFRFLPTHESTEYAKMGASVLIPFLLAVTAGSFTVHTIQSHKDLTLALAGGVLWATVILIIDVVAMSQIAKPVRLPPPKPAKKLFRAMTPAEPEPEPPPPPPVPWLRNNFIALVRISVALVLGLVISHSLILAIFKNRVAQQVQANRLEQLKAGDQQKAELTRLDDRFNEAASVRDIPDDTGFMARYNAYRATPAPPPPSTTGATPAPSGTGTTAATPSDPYSANSAIRMLQTQYNDVLESQRKELAELQSQRDQASAEVNRYDTDLQNAKRMRAAEETGATGNAGKFIFLSAEFRQELSKNFQTSTAGNEFVTSGIPSRGSRWASLGELTSKWEPKVKEKKKALEDWDTQIKNLMETQKTARKASEDKLAGAKADLVNQQYAESKETITKWKSSVANARAELDRNIESLNMQRESQRKLVERFKSPFDTESMDVLEETQALVELVTGHGSAESGFISKTVLMGIVLLMLLAVLMIDLTPLIMKLMKAPSSYDAYLTAAREARFDVPVNLIFVDSEEEFEPAAEPREFRPPPRATGPVVKPPPPPPPPRRNS